MASKRHLRKKRCENKQCYPTLQAATYAVRRLRGQAPDEQFTSYKVGSHWHVGHTPHANFRRVA